MKPLPIPRLFELLLLLPGLLSSLIAGASTSSEQQRWIEVHAQHFAVITDAGEKRGREIVLRFEQMRTVFGGLLMRKRLNLSQPVTIVALKSDQQYWSMAPTTNGHPRAEPGFLLTGEDRSFIVLDAAENEPWRAVSHDVALLLLNYNYPETQAWFDEGLAQYFSSLRVDDQQFEIGGDPARHFSSGSAPAANVSSSPGVSRTYTLLLSESAWLPIADLFRMQRETATPGASPTLFRAESWMVMHYLLSRNLLAQTGTYFDLVQNQKLSVEEAIAKAYAMAPAQFENAVKDYFHSIAPILGAVNAAPAKAGAADAISRTPAPIGPLDVGMSVTPVLEADARALLADIMARMPEHHDPGMSQLTSLAADPGDNEVAQRALGWAYLQKKDYPRAEAELENAIASDARDHWARYYLSVLKYRVAKTGQQEVQGLANMMQDLKTVIDWYPEFAEAYNLLAMARLEGGGTNSALDAMREALRLSPRNQQYVYNLGMIYVSGKKWEQAGAVFERLQSSHDARIAAEARSELAELGSLQKYGTVAKKPVTAAAPGKLPEKSDQAPKVEPSESDAETGQPIKKTEPAPSIGPIEFIKGKLVSVDCSGAPAAILAVISGNRKLSLRTPDYKSLTLIGADAFSCEWKGRQVAVNYRARNKTEGDLVSLEVQ